MKKGNFFWKVTLFLEPGMHGANALTDCFFSVIITYRNGGIAVRKYFYGALLISGALTVIFGVLCLSIGGNVLIAWFTTAGTTCYHFLMRLCIGYLVQGVFPKSVNAQSLWFREHRWEKGFYRWLRVRKWERRVPTFNPDQFDTRTHTYAQLARQTCLSELVHECIVVCGFFSLLFCLFFEDPLGNLPPFLITAVLAGAYDLQFVILQRFHRPRLLRLAAREEKRAEQNEKG